MRKSDWEREEFKCNFIFDSHIFLFSSSGRVFIHPGRRFRRNSFVRLRKLGVFIVNVLIISSARPSVVSGVLLRLSHLDKFTIVWRRKSCTESITQSPQKVGFAKGNVQLRWLWLFQRKLSLSTSVLLAPNHPQPPVKHKPKRIPWPAVCILVHGIKSFYFSSAAWCWLWIFVCH